METSVHHKGVEFEVVEVLRFRWRWTIYAKKSLDLGKTTREFERPPANRSSPSAGRRG